MSMVYKADSIKSILAKYGFDIKGISKVFKIGLYRDCNNMLSLERLPTLDDMRSCFNLDHFLYLDKVLLLSCCYDYYEGSFVALNTESKELSIEKKLRLCNFIKYLRLKHSFSKKDINEYFHINMRGWETGKKIPKLHNFINFLVKLGVDSRDSETASKIYLRESKLGTQNLA